MEEAKKKAGNNANTYTNSTKEIRALVKLNCNEMPALKRFFFFLFSYFLFTHKSLRKAVQKANVRSFVRALAGSIFVVEKHKQTNLKFRFGK